MGPYTFNLLQHLVASVLLISCRTSLKNAVSTGELNNKASSYVNMIRESCWIGVTFLPYFELTVLGIFCAVPNFIGSNLNQLGLVTVEAGKSAFLTSLYMIFTPTIQYCIDGSGTSLSWHTWVASGVSVLGSFLLAGCSELSLHAIGFGEIITVIGAFFWAVAIVAIDYSIHHVNCIDLTCVQMTVSTLLCGAFALVMEPTGISEVLATISFPIENLSDASWILIFLVGIIEAVAFSLDTIGMMSVIGSRAALLMGMDSLVTVVLAYLFLGETLTYPELFGGILLLLSTMIVRNATTEVKGDSETLKSREIAITDLKGAEGFGGEDDHKTNPRGDLADETYATWDKNL